MATGVTLVGCGLVVSAGVAVSPWYWLWSVWLAAAGLIAAGTTVALRRGHGCGGVARVARVPVICRPAAASALVCGTQVAGAGIVAVRDWFNANGAGTVNLSQSELATVVTVAAAMAMAGAVASCVGLFLLWREPVRGWATCLRPRRRGLAIAAVAVAVLLPAAQALAVPADKLTAAGSVALAAALPWAAGLAAAAWLGPRARRAAVSTVLACVTATLAGVLASALAGHVIG
jgi:hypothetical protein